MSRFLSAKTMAAALTGLLAGTGPALAYTAPRLRRMMGIPAAADASPASLLFKLSVEDAPVLIRTIALLDSGKLSVAALEYPKSRTLKERSMRRTLFIALSDAAALRRVSGFLEAAGPEGVRANQVLLGIAEKFKVVPSAPPSRLAGRAFAPKGSAMERGGDGFGRPTERPSVMTGAFQLSGDGMGEPTRFSQAGGADFWWKTVFDGAGLLGRREGSSPAPATAEGGRTLYAAAQAPVVSAQDFLSASARRLLASNGVVVKTKVVPAPDLTVASSKKTPPSGAGGLWPAVQAGMSAAFSAAIPVKSSLVPGFGTVGKLSTAVAAGEAFAPIYAALTESGMPATKTSGEKSGVLRIVAIPVEKIKELSAEAKKKAGKAAKKELYKERKAKLREAFGVAEGVSLGGGGVFKSKILTPEEVGVDPVKRKVRQDAAEKGKKVVFLRTQTIAQLFGTGAIPIDVSLGGATSALGLRLAGLIEIVETRAIPRDKAGAWEHAKRRVFLWPISVEKLKKIMRVGEDLTITGRLDKGAAVAAGMGAELGAFSFVKIGGSARVSVGRAADQWVTLSLKKTAPDKVRVLVQKGDGKVFSSLIQMKAGLDVYDDSWIPRADDTGLENSFVGGVWSEKGGEIIIKQLEKLFKAEISLTFSRGRHGVDTEGWGEVSLSDQRSAEALNSLFKFNPKPLRDLPAEETASDLLKAGRIRSRIRDVTDDLRLQARLSKLRLTKSAGTRFYEMQWQLDDGEVERFLVGIAERKMKGKVTKTARFEETVMWYDLKRDKKYVTVRLGPEKRLMTTTREKINDVIATQKALGVRVKGKIDRPTPYLQFFNLGNYGRTEENGWFSLSPEGVDALGKAKRDQLIAAYLQADWLYEKESYPPGYIWATASKPPPWAETSDPEELAPVLDYLKKNARKIRRARSRSSSGKNGGSSRMRYRAEYAKVAPGRSAGSDAWSYLEAAAYADKVLAMQNSENPEQLIEMFLEFRKGGRVDLKRAVVATGKLAGTHLGEDGEPVPNYDGSIEMKGKRVTLVPVDRPAGRLPDHPLTRFNRVLGDWEK